MIRLIHSKLFAVLFLAILLLGAACRAEPEEALRHVRIDERTPSAATMDTVVTLRGRRFGDQRGSVSWGGAAAEIESWTDNEIQLRTTGLPQKSCSTIRMADANGNTSNPVPLPAAGSGLWSMAHEVPPAIVGGVSVWTGNEMLVWGGGTRKGWRYHPATDRWFPMSSQGAPVSSGSNRLDQGVFAVWSGQEMLLWGVNPNGSIAHRYNPDTDTWRPITHRNAPEGTAVVWTSYGMMVWGRSPGCMIDCKKRSPGGIYDPAADRWEPIPYGPVPDYSKLPARGGLEHTARRESSAIWTGEEVILWGGFALDFEGNEKEIQMGVAYRPATKTWREISSLGAPGARGYHNAVWTGKEMLIWGGTVRQQATMAFRDGAAYDPKHDTWRPIAQAPDGAIGGTANWLDGHLVVIGWMPPESSPDQRWRSLFLLYDLAADAWTDLSSNPRMARLRALHTAVAADAELLVWGGLDDHWTGIREGGRFDVKSRTWTEMRSVKHQPAGLSDATTLWFDGKLFVFGGRDWTGNYSSSDGAIYDAETQEWTSIGDSDFAGSRSGAHAVWTGSEIILSGGLDVSEGIVRGTEAYNPATDTWRTLSSAPGELDHRGGHAAVWTGAELLIWGGFPVTGYTFHPASNLWSPLPMTGEPPRTLKFLQGAGAPGVAFVAGVDAKSNVIAGLFDTSLRAWRTVPSVKLRLIAPQVVTTATGFIVIGSSKDSPGQAAGAFYDLDSNSWKAMDLAGTSVVAGAGYVWTGTHLLSYSGYTDPETPVGFTWKAATNKITLILPGCLDEEHVPQLPGGYPSIVSTWLNDRMIVRGPSGFLTFIP